VGGEHLKIRRSHRCEDRDRRQAAAGEFGVRLDTEIVSALRTLPNVGRPGLDLCGTCVVGVLREPLGESHQRDSDKQRRNHRSHHRTSKRRRVLHDGPLGALLGPSTLVVDTRRLKRFQPSDRFRGAEISNWVSVTASPAFFVIPQARVRRWFGPCLRRSTTIGPTMAVITTPTREIAAIVISSHGGPEVPGVHGISAPTLRPLHRPKPDRDAHQTVTKSRAGRTPQSDVRNRPDSILRTWESCHSSTSGDLLPRRSTR
jgi:hypothetical protein